MFTYFNKNKLKYNKGQMAPFFILILVIIITMAMVTVNLSKVALNKTESSNAADAGALAAGSIMANVFNSVAKQNSQMEFQYWTFYTSVSVLFTVATYLLAHALVTACWLSCEAAAVMAWATGVIISIGIATLAFGIAQIFLYQLIRSMAEQGRDGAIKAGHQFVFFNSGIGSKLKEGAQRDTFSNFANSLGEEETYAFSWVDGQGRQHNVTSRVSTKKVDTFDMQVTVLPSSVETALLFAAQRLASFASMELIAACICETCRPFPPCVACQAKNCALAIKFIIPAIVLLAAAWAGLAPGTVIKDDSSILNALMWNYCWIDDIDHDRLVQVRTMQHHEGTDLGLWQTQYPDTTSYSIANFRGRGQIHPPKLRHGCDIIETDKMSGS